MAKTFSASVSVATTGSGWDFIFTTVLELRFIFMRISNKINFILAFVCEYRAKLTSFTRKMSSIYIKIEKVKQINM